ncbi:MAG: FAD-dependent oxidoreductase, partial [Tannerella sp.]|nr:FAD-dependent oxidoreductase [Tannerella sp.]
MNKKLYIFMLMATVSLYGYGQQTPETVLVEAEHFTDYGGWGHDTQFMDQMGSPFLLAHGLGIPVKDAVTELKLAPGTYRVWVRTRDWVAEWKAPGTPGKFQLLVNGKPLETTFGTEKAEWHWQYGGTTKITGRTTKIALHDLTGFEGRCDAVLFSRDKKFVPANEPKPLAEMRRQLLGFPETPEFKEHFDLVVVGGGIAGICSAVSAARYGLTVALIQDRPVLGNTTGSDPSISIRGRNSISGSTSPLIVLDGIIYRGSLVDINPNDIESVDILKDA